jgi:hypothetical protein
LKSVPLPLARAVRLRWLARFAPSSQPPRSRWPNSRCAPAAKPLSRTLQPSFSLPRNASGRVMPNALATNRQRGAAGARSEAATR